ncbi:putative toxin-antitoxin system antitoxin component (TIGR02293 family) [Azomonas agilis]|uniref:Putative toxin-antitoxin system antitoxin component (TIGR02293 family) n=1 Tax=Azomonas agilis TaxID=116849 RepID=A0A562HZG8_9GAMM|nr:antitoxin Xre/MbcA/ParS toxin-binding domain-containing protein [Azomonas agilis]TWH64177.1 putative toxin-antitoxin system antitoxin component (TIGR02293 family) [Azomonas agilis]
MSTLRPSDQLSSIVPEFDIRTPVGYLKALRSGVTGTALKAAVATINDRELFSRVTGKDATNFSKLFRLKVLPGFIADSMLDTVRVYMLAADIFGSLELARDWMNTPIPALGGEIPASLLDSNAGREMVRVALRKIQFGEFS